MDRIYAVLLRTKTQELRMTSSRGPEIRLNGVRFVRVHCYRPATPEAVMPFARKPAKAMRSAAMAASPKVVFPSF
jgi:hypothetical protein